jgi:hypothetical protein
MTSKPADWWRWVKGVNLDPLSPRGFFATAAILALAFGACSLAGLREDTTFLSGTPNGGSWPATVGRGVLYLYAYFGFVLLAPILCLAAALLGLWRRFGPKRERPGSTGSGAPFKLAADA